MFSLSYAWIICWVNNREAGDLRRHHAHSDVTVMFAVLLAWDSYWKKSNCWLFETSWHSCDITVMFCDVLQRKYIGVTFRPWNPPRGSQGSHTKRLIRSPENPGIHTVCIRLSTSWHGQSGYHTQVWDNDGKDKPFTNSPRFNICNIYLPMVNWSIACIWPNNGVHFLFMKILMLCYEPKIDWCHD